jgi:hypothetical protein
MIDRILHHIAAQSSLYQQHPRLGTPELFFQHPNTLHPARSPLSVFKRLLLLLLLLPSEPDFRSSLLHTREEENIVLFWKMFGGIT